MQAIFNYVSVVNLEALAIIAAMAAILAANCSYQKRRSLACDRIAARVAPPGARRERDAGRGMAAPA